MTTTQVASKQSKLDSRRAVVAALLLAIGFGVPLYNYYYQELSQQVKLVALAVFSLVFAAGVFLRGPWPQDLRYHDFADKRSLYGCCVPNTFDVLSNLPFACVGLNGLSMLFTRRAFLALGENEWCGWFVFSIGVFFVSLGSAFYHWRPNNQRLVWDRLPMTMGFMSIFALVIEERLNIEKLTDGLIPSSWVFVACLVAGLLSVVYWAIVDDLRPYYVVQGLPIVTIPLMLALFPAQFPGRGSHLIRAIVVYALAKVVEHYDKPIYRLTGRTMSGHTMKHLLAAWACHIIVKRMLDARI